MKNAPILLSAILLLLAACGSDSASVATSTPSLSVSSAPVPVPAPVPAVEGFTSYQPTMRFSASTTLRERMQGKLVGAHQGGAISLGGNTISRFETAYQAGVDIIEMDLRLTKDGVPIVYHDETLDSLTNCKGAVVDKTWAEIKECNKLFFYKIPSFEEVLLWSGGKVILNAEFKSKDVIIPALEMIQKHTAHNWTYFQTKDDPVRYQVARDYDQEVGLLFAPNDEAQVQWALDQNDDNLIVIELHENIRTPAIIDAIHSAGKLASENSWHFSLTRELFVAACTKVYEADIDIAITDKSKSCVEQRNYFY